MRPLLTLAPLLLVSALALAAPSTAAAGSGASDQDHIEARELLRRGEILPLSRILAIVLERVPGDVIDVELEPRDGVWEYEVKVLTSTGRVREVKLNARTGAIREIEDD